MGEVIGERVEADHVELLVSFPIAYALSPISIGCSYLMTRSN